MLRKRIFSGILCILLIMTFLPIGGLVEAAAVQLPPAFPGAEGFGAYASGGRGGDVYHVITLNPTGPGSFYEGITTGGNNPRTIVFDVSGYIDMPQLKTSRSNLTIAGQTAPGDGVTIRSNTLHFSGASNVILRYMHFRRGQQEGRNDSMYIEQCKDIIIDHCSFSWGGDEVLSVDNSENVTVQWSIVAEGPRPHSMGGLVQWNTISMHHNLYAHNNDRNPKAKGNIDFVNNVVYNWGQFSFVAGDSAGLSYGNVEKNYFVAGYDSVKPEYAVMRGNENFSLYLSGNFIDSNRNGVLDGTDTGTAMMDPAVPCKLVSQRFEYPLINTEDPLSAYHHVLEKAGASISRDAVDKRIIEGVKNQTGKIIEHEDEVGSYLPLASGTALADTDGDGMPDVWETAHGLNPADAGDGKKDQNGDGYTNLEDYLNERAVTGFPNNTPPPTLSVPPSQTELKIVDYRFDFGTTGSPLEADYTRVTNLTAYSISSGFGFSDTSAVITRDRNTSDNIRRDFCLAASTSVPITFNVDVPNGYYRVKVISGDSTAGNNTGLSLEGGVVQSLVSTAGSFAEPTYIVHVADGQLNLILSKDGRINALEVATVPYGLRVTETTSTSVGLTWTGVNGVEGYNVYRAAGETDAYSKIGSSLTAAFIDTAVTLGDTYYYKVSAVSGNKESAQSEAVNMAFVDPAVAVPPVPSGLTAGEVTGASVILRWTPVKEAARYYIYRADAANGAFVRVGNSTAAVYTDSTVSTNIPYYYKVSAMNAGGESAASDSAISSLGLAPEVPAELKAVTTTSAAVLLNWAPSRGASGYQIYRAAEAESAYTRIGTAATTSYTDQSVSTGTTYHYKVTGVNTAGESTASGTVSATANPLICKFDFGTASSTVEPGYTQISNASAYTPSIGYGFANASAVATRERKGPDDLRKDFCIPANSSVPITFNVDLPYGEYSVKVISGDFIAANKTSISIEGGPSELYTTATNVFTEKTWNIKVTDGQLNLTFSNDGRVNAVEVIEIDTAKPLIVIASPVNASYKTTDTLTVSYAVYDKFSGVKASNATLNGNAVVNNQVIPLNSLAGTNTLHITAQDVAGNTAEQTVTFDVTVASAIDIDPDTLNLKSGGGKNSMIVYIEFPSGYDVSLINIATVKMTVNGQDISSQTNPTEVGDANGNKVIDRMVKFDRQKVVEEIRGKTGNIEMIVSGSLQDGKSFKGSDTIRVIN